MILQICTVHAMGAYCGALLVRSVRCHLDAAVATARSIRRLIQGHAVGVRHLFGEQRPAAYCRLNDVQVLAEKTGC